MSSTIENTNENILNKICYLRKILNIYNLYDFLDNDNTNVSKLLDEIEQIETIYELGSIDILSSYSKNKNNRKTKKYIYIKFMNFVEQENILGRIKRVYKKCKLYNKKYYIKDENINLLFEDYDFSNINISYSQKNNEYCECGNKFRIESKTSEMICISCGSTKKLYGIVFEDEHFFYQEGTRTKHGKYDPTKHCKFWLDRIQAKENTEIPPEVIDSIKKCIKRDDFYLEQLNCPIIRQYLKTLRLTNYNDHVPLILKIITGKEPAQLKENELKIVYIYFSRVIQIYNRTKPNNKPNCPYHPFFIYKILEQILKTPEQVKRKKNILSCIHLQSRETLIENDILWKTICYEIKEFEYIPTDGS